uniref:EXPERA domain-containing protein n=1 Tax=Picea sitchensis TaxID=3332 RepID=A9NQ16_PICSI|nr:unknown [Picea sitchensis]
MTTQRSACSCLGKSVNMLLLTFFSLVTIATVLIDSQAILPACLFPDPLRYLVDWYAAEYGDYLVKNKPPFFVGCVVLEILIQCPLAIANIYGIIKGKRWFQTTCLIYGVCTATTMIPILADILASDSASSKLLGMYIPFLIFPLIAIGRGLAPLQSFKSPASSVKKRA